MDILKSIETYTIAQKWVGTNFMILGAVLLVLSAMFALFVTKSPLATGVKWGGLIAGLFIFVGGFSYRNFSEKTQKQVIELHQKNQTECLNSEHKRMEKVDKGFLTYQITFASFLLLCIGVILFVGNPFFKGIAFAFALQVLGMMLIESFSHQSISNYTNELRSEINKVQSLSK